MLASRMTCSSNMHRMDLVSSWCSYLALSHCIYAAFKLNVGGPVVEGEPGGAIAGVLRDSRGVVVDGFCEIDDFCHGRRG
ncbi:hypothetical protein EUGRSUZ_E01000 [Eucalyptus grandis]|uniref:Uncharacterized protein n=2 Tax=Eucalyptus grandis TaxID=71139 RepID=A0ACC3KQ97_EUCGR|nr:hypothetical protein EUGRSUZ_E01000 [Eucalyptus grandis]